MIDVRNYGKKLAEWGVVFAFGLWFGLNYAGKQAYQGTKDYWLNTTAKLNPTVAITEPAWVGEIQGMVELSVLLMAVGAGGWILLDYLGERND